VPQEKNSHVNASQSRRFGGYFGSISNGFRAVVNRGAEAAARFGSARVREVSIAAYGAHTPSDLSGARVAVASRKILPLVGAEIPQVTAWSRGLQGRETGVDGFLWSMSAQRRNRRRDSRPARRRDLARLSAGLACAPAGESGSRALDTRAVIASMAIPAYQALR
jgi:hypothetical protein